MSLKQGGSFATLLLSVPLVAIPLMAIFGIPEFAQVSASTKEGRDGPDIIRQPTRLMAADEPRSAQSLRSDAPVWGADPSSSDEATPRKPHAFRNIQNVKTEARPKRPSPRPMQTAAIEPIVSDAPETELHAEPPTTASGLTWRKAARQLEEIGIDNYRLERGRDSDQFLFVCLFSPGTDTRIVQRFEAESPEPLEAVEDVLEQVDQWLQHRHSQNRSWVQQ